YGSWHGRLPPGRYQVTIAGEGFVPRSEPLDVPRHGRPFEKLFQLASDRSWIAPGLLFVEAMFGYLGGISFDGLDTGRPVAPCSLAYRRRSGVNGVTGGTRVEITPGAVSARLPEGLGLGVEWGALGAWTSVDRDLTCPAFAPARYAIHDA